MTLLSIQALLVSLDLGVAFDTITYNILLSRLSVSFGVSGTALLWLSSYIIGQSQIVRLENSTSSTLNCSSGVHQGSVLGPILLSINVSSVYHIAQSINISVKTVISSMLSTSFFISPSPPRNHIMAYILFTYSTINRKPYKKNGMRK